MVGGSLEIVGPLLVRSAVPYELFLGTVFAQEWIAEVVKRIVP